MKSWINEFPDRWPNEQRIAREVLSAVSFETSSDGSAVVYGAVSVERKRLGEIGPFFIKVVYPPDFPGHDPNVYLISHETWRDPGNHIEKDGRFCWSEVKDAPIDFERLDSLRLLIENIGYRLAQTELRMRTGKDEYPGPDRSHYVLGELEAKADRKRRGIGPNTRPCICGKDVKFKRCHGRREVFKGS